jgi:hypothetical protein
MDADDPNNPNGTPPGGQPPPAAPTFTQEQVNSIAAAARREAEARYSVLKSEIESLKAAMAKPAVTAEKAPVQTTAVPAQAVQSNPVDVDRQIKFHSTLNRFSERNQWSPEIEARVESWFKAENPENIPEWFQQTAALIKSVPAPHATAEAAKVPTPPNAPPPIAQSAPSTAVPLERDVDIFSMRPDEVHEMIRKKGGDVSRPYDPKNRSGRREIRKAFEAALQTKRVVLGSR